MTKKHRILLALCLLLLGCSSLGRFTTYSLSTYEKESSSSKRDVEEYLVQENPVDSLNIRISGNEYFLLAGIIVPIIPLFHSDIIELTYEVEPDDQCAVVYLGDQEAKMHRYFPCDTIYPYHRGCPYYEPREIQEKIYECHYIVDEDDIDDLVTFKFPSGQSTTLRINVEKNWKYRLY
jgi:hypothetical protein